MSKPAPEKPSGVPETTAPSPTGVTNTALEHHLIHLNVNDHVEKKQNLSYLSWAWAWQEALRVDPSATFNVQTFDGKAYMDVNGTGMVWVTVSLGERSRTCFLPIMDHRNKPITNPDAFAVNTAIMRCMTKCLALFGLGLYIYAGEDLPPDAEGEPEQTKGNKQEQANMNLFIDGLLEYLTIATNEKELKSYWKSNQTQIDTVKAQMPDRYKEIVEKFKAANEAFTKGASNE